MSRNFTVIGKHPNGVSKYMPHQGKRECLRRRLGGFHRFKKLKALYQKYGPESKSNEQDSQLIESVPREVQENIDSMLRRAAEESYDSLRPIPPAVQP